MHTANVEDMTVDKDGVFDWNYDDYDDLIDRKGDDNDDALSLNYCYNHEALLGNDTHIGLVKNDNDYFIYICIEIYLYRLKH